jgi:hypothetical protein
MKQKMSTPLLRVVMPRWAAAALPVDAPRLGAGGFAGISPTNQAPGPTAGQPFYLVGGKPWPPRQGMSLN